MCSKANSSQLPERDWHQNAAVSRVSVFNNYRVPSAQKKEFVF